MFLIHVNLHLASCKNLRNYDNIFHEFDVCCDILEKKGLNLVIFGTVINHNMGLMHVKYNLAVCQNVVFMSSTSHILYVVVCAFFSWVQ